VFALSETYMKIKLQGEKKKKNQTASLVPTLEGTGSIFITWDCCRHTEAQRKLLSKPPCCCCSK